MKTRLLLILSLLFCAPLLLHAEWVQLAPSDQPVTVTVPESYGARTVLDYTVNGFDQGQVNIDGKTYMLLTKLRKESTIEEVGCPRLPRFCRSIVIPDEGVMGYRILAADYVEFPGVDLAPSKGFLTRDVDPATVAYTFSEVYRTDAFYPGKLVSLRDPYILRDLRGMVVELNAFQYNPVQRILRVYTHVRVEINRTAPGGKNVLLRTVPFEKVDPQFHMTYKRHFVNFSDDDRYPLLEEPGEMLVISYDSFMPTMQYLVDWKNQKGIPTTMVPVSQVGTTPDAVKSYIQTYYHTHDLSYVLLVGDAAQVPAWTSGSDPVYSLMNASDWYPSIFVGRFSAENQAQVRTQVERTLRYEAYPPTAEWFHKGFGTADQSGPTNPEPTDALHITYIAQDFVHWHYTQMDSVYTPWGNTSMIMHFVNLGRTVWNYAGHGNTTMFGPPNFTISDVANLRNDNRLPHISTVACNVGQFNNTTCIAEALLRATNPATGAPTGAIGCYMSKISQTWFPPYDAQDEAVDLLCADSMFTMGGFYFNGSGLMIDNYGAQGENEFKNWNIFGDPSLMVRSLTPYPLTVTHDSTLQVGDTTFAVTVMASGNPQPGAMVCAMNDEIYATGVTNAAGQVTLILNPAPAQTGSFTLTVTTPNSLPNVAQVGIVAAGALASVHCQSTTTELTGSSPNPFNPTTALSYQLQAASQVRLTVWDTAGRLVNTLVDGQQEAGQHSVTFDGSRLASGVYLVKFAADERTQVQKIVLMK